MLGLGSNLIKAGTGVKGIVTDNLVLRHGYAVNPVQPLSDGAAFFVSSANDYVTMGDASDLSFGTGSFSVAAWVNTNQTGATRQFLGKRAGVAVANQGFSLYLGNSGTDWVLNVADGTDYIAVATTTEANANQWYHVCGTFDGVAKTAKLYVDGVLAATTTNTDVGDVDVSNAFIIGGGSDSTSTQKWDGYVCNTGTWNAILSQAQVKSIMNKNYDSLSASEKTDLVSWWNLDSVIPEATTLVYDNHHGDEGVVLGGEMVQNGSFDNGTTNWTKATTASSTQEIIDGALKMYSGTADDNSNLLSKTSGYNMGGVSGKMYRLTITSSNYSSGNGKIRLDAVYLAGAAGSISFTAGTKYVYFVAYRDFSFIQFIGSSHSTHYTIDDVSLKLVNGNTGTLS